MILKILRVTLGNAGFDVVVTTDPEEALALARQREFAVVVSDQQMPSMMGSELLSQIAIIQPEATRILITGVRSLESFVDAVNRGELFRFVTKPWVRAEMLATMQNAIQRYELVHAKAQLERQTQLLNQELASANARLEQQVQELEHQRQQLDRSKVALHHSLDRSLELCHRILSLFHPHLGAKTKTVVRLCQQMAEVGGFDPEQKHILFVSAWLHDIGLAGLPSNLSAGDQQNPGTFPPEIRNLLLEHPIYAQTIASFVDHLQSVGETVRAHHERFDGSGYPDGAAGSAIPWTARCLAVADYYVSSELPHDRITEELLALSGSAFDPEAVRLFLRCQLETPSRHGRQASPDSWHSPLPVNRGVYTATGSVDNNATHPELR
jgi:response regulator RpfG family c-di-GMP phosphodiesterase